MMFLRKSTNKLYAVLVIFSFIFLFFFTVSDVLGSEQTIVLQNITYCNDSVVRITVIPLEELFSMDYTLHGCRLLNALSNLSKQQWECFCKRNLTITLETLQGKPKIYMYSVVSAQKRNASFYKENTGAVSSFISFNASLPSFSNNSSLSRQKAKQTAGTNVTFNEKNSFPKVIGLVLFCMVLLFVLALIICVDRPWLSKKERARRFHKQARIVYAKGNHKRAKRYYRKAALLRNND